MKNPRHVYDVLRPLLLLSKVFGFSAFELKGEPPYVRMEATRANYASLLFNLGGNSLCVFLSNQGSRLSKTTGSKVIDGGLIFLFPFGAIVLLALAVDSFFRRKTTCAIMAEFFVVDRSLERKNQHVDHKRQLKALSWILTLSAAMVTIGTLFSLSMYFFWTFSLKNHLINAFSYCFTGCEFLIVNFNFICAARLVAFRLNDVNSCIKRHLQSGKWLIVQNNRWGRKMDPIDVVEELAEDVARLVRIVERINRFYANQILGCILGVAMFSIFIIYVSAYSFIAGANDVLRLTAILLTAWVFYVIMIVYIFSAGVEVDDGGRAIVLTLNEAVLLAEDKAAKRKLLHFSQQMLLRAPRMQSLFCDFNWATMFSITGFIVTYLVILMQFDNISEYSLTDKMAE